MRARELTLTALFAALTAAAAFVKVPTPLSTFSLQFLATALAGILLGGRLGAISQAVYVALGLAGLPIFTAGGGPQYMLQPTFGFLLGLIPAAFIIGRLTEKSKRKKRITLACLAGLGVLYLIGLPYMGIIIHFYMGKPIGLSAILWGGMIIFLPGDAVKIAAAVLLGARLSHALPGERGQKNG
jgi:biotin transport system substrate-specific component